MFGKIVENQSDSLDKKKVIEQVKKSIAILFPNSNSSSDFDVKVKENGLLIVPRIGSAVAVTSEFYFKILEILEVSLWPMVQMQHPLTMKLVHVNGADWRKARAFFYPWMIGASERLVISSDDLIRRSQQENVFPLMSNIELPLNQHLILTGQTGSGKSYMLRQILDVISANSEKVILVDGKLSDGSRYAKLKNTNNIKVILPKLDEDSTGGSIGNELLDSVNDELDDLENIMYQRQRKLYDSGLISCDYSDVGLKPIYLVIDELGALTIGVDKKGKDTFFDHLIRLALLARESGIVMILCLQQARNDELPTVVRSQMGTKILLGSADRDNAQFLFPNLDKIPFLPAEGKGTGIMSVAGSRKLKGIIPIATPTIKESR